MGGGGGGIIVNYLDSILVPVSLFFILGYHAYLWHNLKHKPILTSIGINTLKRRQWLQELNQGDEKKGMLAVQSLRNTLMYAILTATITVVITISLAALTNNAFNAGGLLSRSDIFGSQTGRIMVLKFGSASIFLLGSFMCSSMAVGCLIDANYLINAIGEFSPAMGGGYTETVVERGFALAVVGNRVLCVAFPLLVWLLGPLPMALSSLGLVWGLYGLDFLPNSSQFN